MSRSREEMMNEAEAEIRRANDVLEELGPDLAYAKEQEVAEASQDVYRTRGPGAPRDSSPTLCPPPSGGGIVQSSPWVVSAVVVRVDAAGATVRLPEELAVGGHEKLPGDGHETARWRT